MIYGALYNYSTMVTFQFATLNNQRAIAWPILDNPHKRLLIANCHLQPPKVPAASVQGCLCSQDGTSQRGYFHFYLPDMVWQFMGHWIRSVLCFFPWLPWSKTNEHIAASLWIISYEYDGDSPGAMRTRYGPTPHSRFWTIEWGVLNINRRNRGCSR